MTVDDWINVFYWAVGIGLSIGLLAYMVQPKKPVKKPRAKRPHKSRSQRRMEREIYRRAIDAGASEAEARKAVRIYAAKKELNATIL